MSQPRARIDGAHRAYWRIAAVAALAATLFGATELTFHRWLPHLLMGDDLNNYVQFLDGRFASTPVQALTQSSAEKFRPVFALAMEALFSAFASHVRHYMLFNIGLNALSGLVLAGTVFLASGRRPIIAIAAAIMTATSHFLLYQIAQVTGVLEGLGYLFFLLMVFGVVGLHADPTIGRRKALAFITIAIIAQWLLVFTHERYLLTGVWLAAMLLLAPAAKSLTPSGRFTVLGLSLAPTVINLAYKVLVLKQAIFVGTGGTHIRLDLGGMIDRLIQAALSLLGFNDGPEYLVGFSVAAHPFNFVGAAGLIYLVLLISLVVLTLRSLGRPGTNFPGERLLRLRLPLSLAILAGLLLAPPLLTIRLEQRWLVEPFALLVISAAWFAGKLVERHSRVGHILFVALAAASMVIGVRLGRAADNIFFVYSDAIADHAKHDIINAPAMPNGVDIIAPPDVCGWVLLNGEFFHLYAPKLGSYQCVTSVDQLDHATYKQAHRPRIFTLESYNFVDVSASAYDQLQELDSIPRVDLLRRFDVGRINSEGHADNPTGKGAMLFDLDGQGGPIRTLTVLTGFTYRYDHLAVRPGDRLRFGAAMVFPTRTPAEAVVSVIGANGRTATAFDVVLPLRPPGGAPQTVQASIPLDGFGPDVSVVFKTSTPGVDRAGHWVAYEQPRIVGMGPHAGSGARSESIL